MDRETLDKPEDQHPDHRPIVAVTGGTGFLGRHLVAALHGQGWRVRVLSRSGAAPPEAGDIVRGDLADTQALRRLLEGADVLVHAAGLVKAKNAGEFRRVNVEATAHLLGILEACAPDAHTVLVSSLAAREPALSAYAASKCEAESIAVGRLPSNRLTIVRPPALYGPHDRATLAFFKAARLPLTPLAGDGKERIALMHGEDAAAAISALAAARMPGRFALADDRPSGYSMREILQAAAYAQGRKPRYVRMPTSILVAAGYGAAAFGRLTGSAAMLSPGKVREMRHADWSVRPDEMPSGLDRKPRSLAAGFADTVEWYRGAGWL